MPLYDYTITGLDGNDNTWTVAGKVQVDEFIAAPTFAMQDGFRKLTQGEAVYGQPGVGCRGPYKVTNMTIGIENGKVETKTGLH